MTDILGPYTPNFDPALKNSIHDNRIKGNPDYPPANFDQMQERGWEAEARKKAARDRAAADAYKELIPGPSVSERLNMRDRTAVMSAIAIDASRDEPLPHERSGSIPHPRLDGVIDAAERNIGSVTPFEDMETSGRVIAPGEDDPVFGPPDQGKN